MRAGLSVALLIAALAGCRATRQLMPVYLKAERYEVVLHGEPRLAVTDGQTRGRLERTLEIRDERGAIVSSVVARASLEPGGRSREELSPELAFERRAAEVDVELAFAGDPEVWRARGTLEEVLSLERTDTQWKESVLDRALHLTLARGTGEAGDISSDGGRGILVRLGGRLHRLDPTRSAVGYLHHLDGRLAGYLTAAPRYLPTLRNAWLLTDLPTATKREALMAELLVSTVCDLTRWPPTAPP